MIHLKNLMLSKSLAGRRPAQEILAENPHDPAGHLQACAGDQYYMVYIPTGKKVKIHLERIKSDEVRCWWFDPRSGDSQLAGNYPTGGIAWFDPPGERERGNDWVLVIEAANARNVDMEQFYRYRRGCY